ncbi:IclR family transcriptional regulator [Deinococcus aestuarii]|uniref:IclR family transcriptional regulator n=1 Tax=Deinococcus aestuarii TaxID=2774531 RepID=UPI001C0B58B9|nr:IclR family transcriptional regulator [Deinococcus aestuarii]
MLGTFEKARAVLDLYSTEHPEWGVSEVARRLGMPTSSAHTLLASLAGMGLLHRTLAGRYRLGFKLLALSQILLANTPWREVAREEMARLAALFGETVHLAAFDGGQIVKVAQVEGRLPDSARGGRVGAVLAAHASASGKVLLAHRPWEVVETVLGAAGMERFTGQTLHTPGALAQELAQIRARGWAAEVGERRAGVGSLAAPVRNHNGEVIAAMSLSVPETRFREREALWRDAVVGACEDLSVRLGYQAGTSGSGPLLWMSVQGRDELRPAPRHTSTKRRRPPRKATPDRSGS